MRTKTKDIPQVTKDLQKLLKQMEETLIEVEGLGLAAPQVGESMRVCLARLNEVITPLINPQITWKSEEEDIAEEGCLSLPGIGVDVPRAKSIVLTYLDCEGDRQERKLTDMDARVVQHEVDHLDGVLIVDYLS